jgi:hypothetical protein
LAKKSKNKAVIPFDFKPPEWLRNPQWLRHPRTARVVAYSGFFALGVFGASYLLDRLEVHVHGMPKYDKFVLAIEWQDLPELLRRPDNRHILESLQTRIDLRTTDRILDPDLARRVGESLSEPSIGWVKSVDRVTVQPDGVLAIKCTFREPVAYVQHDDACYLVDRDGVLLPGWYRTEDCSTSKLLLITGVKQKPPTVGYPWIGSDLQSGLKLAGLISGRSFRNQVDRIIVTNYEGRLDRKRPYIELATDRAGSRIWWGQPPNQEDGTETTADQKLALLDWLFHEHGRIDLNRAYVDVRTHPNSVSIAKNPKPS